MSAASVATAPSRTVAVLCVGAMALVWGSTWVVIKEGADHLPPFTAAAARFVVAGLAMIPVCRLLAAREGGGRAPFGLVLAMACMQFAGSYAIVYWAETVLPSGLTAVLWATYPLLLSLAVHVVIPGERLRGRQWLGMVVGFCGIVCLFATDLRRAGSDWLGAGATLLLSPLIVAVCNALVRRYGRGFSSLRLNRDGMLLGAALLCALALATERDAPARWTGAAMFTVVYLALAGTCLTFSLYFWLLRHVPAHKLALTAYVTPLIALALGMAVRGEPITATTLAGTGLVLLGVAVAR